MTNLSAEELASYWNKMPQIVPSRVYWSYGLERAYRFFEYMAEMDGTITLDEAFDFLHKMENENST